jgi:hypothetical protein
MFQSEGSQPEYNATVSPSFTDWNLPASVKVLAVFISDVVLPVTPNAAEFQPVVCPLVCVSQNEFSTFVPGFDPPNPPTELVPLTLPVL